ncbi:MAG: hypothetical protein NTY35_11875 [Planctomycetota bacterium]|nr:hypothetical protein [Planctomycetota bacterium]
MPTDTEPTTRKGEARGPAQPFTPHSRTARAWLPWALLALVPWALGAWALRFTCDDAYISFRYAANLVAGDGLVYNVGETPPVEGYSNLLWTLASAAALALRLDPAVVANVLAAASAAALILLVARFAHVRFGLSGLGCGIVALFVGILPPVSCWSTGGLETMTFALAVFLVYERIASGPGAPRGWQAGIAAALAALLRADGAGWVLAALAVAWVDAGSRPEVRAAVVRAALLLGAAVCAQLAFRLAWHQDWIPNTARVKAGLSAMRIERGAKYVGMMLVAMPALLLAPLLALIATRGTLKCPRRVSIAAAVFAVVAAGYSIWAGGDFLPFGRFLLPAVPFVGLAFACLLARPAAWVRVAAALLLATAPLATLGVQAVPRALHFRWNEAEPIDELTMLDNVRYRAEQWALVGRALSTRCAGQSIVLGGIGAVGYFSGLRVLDLFGLVSPAVARLETPLERSSPGHDRRVDPEFFLPERPDLLGAWISSTSATLAGLPPHWQGLVAANQARVERWPLAEDEDFPPGTELRVLRIVYDR